MSTDSPSTTDRLAWIKRRLHLATPRDVGPREADFDAECRRLQTARLDLSVWAPLDIEFLLRLVGVLEGQLATARALHRPERRYTPDDGETSYATYSEAADASFDGTGRPAMVTFFEVCSHCASIEMAEGCDHQYKESLWPCKEGVALGLDGGDPDGR